MLTSRLQAQGEKHPLSRASKRHTYMLSECLTSDSERKEAASLQRTRAEPVQGVKGGLPQQSAVVRCSCSRQSSYILLLPCFCQSELLCDQEGAKRTLQRLKETPGTAARHQHLGLPPRAARGPTPPLANKMSSDSHETCEKHQFCTGVSMVEHQQGMLPSYILCPAAKTSDKESSFNLRARILIGYFSSAKIA